MGNSFADVQWVLGFGVLVIAVPMSAIHIDSGLQSLKISSSPYMSTCLYVHACLCFSVHGGQRLALGALDSALIY